MTKQTDQPKIKICGITDLADARFVAGAQADYMGFNFYEGSSRYIEPGQAGAIINWIEGPQHVGVFVNQQLDDVNKTARHVDLDIVQLHGDESAEYCSSIEKPIIKAIHVEEESTAQSLQKEVKKYRPLVDYILFDTDSQGQWGGTGQTFNWNVLSELNIEMPFFLSGGLNAENIQDACQAVQPYGVDLCSGLEGEPGRKDFDQVEAFMNQFRTIPSTL